MQITAFLYKIEEELPIGGDAYGVLYAWVVFQCVTILLYR